MNNIPAFPTGLITDPRNGQIIGGSNGMTLRDYFATKAMQGFCSTLGDVSPNSPPYWNVLAIDAYEMADAMMKAREKK